MTTSASTNLLIHTIVDNLEAVKAKDILVVDVSKQSSLFSYMVLGTGESNRQVKAMGQRIEAGLKAGGYEVLGIEGLENGEWVLVDAGEVIIHAMQRAVRDFYDIESLWGAKVPSNDILEASGL
ncbi:MAG: ribosome silencing factor [Neisseriaceae bacterium]